MDPNIQKLQDGLDRQYTKEYAEYFGYPGTNEDIRVLESKYPFVRDYISIIKNSERHNRERTNRAKRNIRNFYDACADTLELRDDYIGPTDRWINWDIAKQHFMHYHPEISQLFPKYKTRDPFESWTMQRTIVARHIAWTWDFIYKQKPIIPAEHALYEDFSRIVNTQKKLGKYGHLEYDSYTLQCLGELLIRYALTNESVQLAMKNFEKVIVIENKDPLGYGPYSRDRGEIIDNFMKSQIVNRSTQVTTLISK